MKEKTFDRFKNTIVEGRVCLHSIEFGSTNSPFSAYYEASEFIKEMGYISASMCGRHPIGFVNPNEFSYVAKWNNLNKEDKFLLDGIILPLNDFREGSCSVLFFNKPNY